MRHVVPFTRRTSQGNNFSLSSLLSVFVTVGKVNGDEGKWQYCFYNVWSEEARRNKREQVNVKVTSRVELPVELHDGFSVGCGRALSVRKVLMATGIVADDIEPIVQLTQPARRMCSPLKYIISAMEVYGVKFDSLTHILEMMRDEELLRKAGCAETLAEKSEQHSSHQQISEQEGSEQEVNPRQLRESRLMNKLEQMFANTKPGTTLYYNERAAELNTRGDVGLGELAQSLRTPDGPQSSASLAFFEACCRPAQASKLRKKSDTAESVLIPVPLRKMGLQRPCDIASRVDEETDRTEKEASVDDSALFVQVNKEDRQAKLDDKAPLFSPSIPPPRINSLPTCYPPQQGAPLFMEKLPFRFRPRMQPPFPPPFSHHTHMPPRPWLRRVPPGCQMTPMPPRPWMRQMPFHWRMGSTVPNGPLAPHSTQRFMSGPPQILLPRPSPVFVQRPQFESVSTPAPRERMTGEQTTAVSHGKDPRTHEMQPSSSKCECAANVKREKRQPPRVVARHLPESVVRRAQHWAGSNRVTYVPVARLCHGPEDRLHYKYPSQYEAAVHLSGPFAQFQLIDKEVIATQGEPSPFELEFDLHSTVRNASQDTCDVIRLPPTVLVKGKGDRKTQR